MNKQLRTEEEASLELQDAIRWYEEQSVWVLAYGFSEPWMPQAGAPVPGVAVDLGDDGFRLSVSPTMSCTLRQSMPFESWLLPMTADDLATGIIVHLDIDEFSAA